MRSLRRGPAAIACVFAASVLLGGGPVAAGQPIAVGPIVYTGPSGVPFIANMDGSGARPLVPVVSGESWGPPAWSANGQLIVAVRRNAFGGRLLLMDPNGAVVSSYAVPLAHASCSGSAPSRCGAAFSPDATRIVYGAGSGLRILDRAAGTTSPVPNTLATADLPAWSPGGGRIAYTEGSYPTSAVVVAPNGNGKQVLRTGADYRCQGGQADCHDQWGPSEWTPGGDLLLPQAHSFFYSSCQPPSFCGANEWFLERVDAATGAQLDLSFWEYHDVDSRVALTPDRKTLVVRGSGTDFDSLAMTAYPPQPPPGETWVKATPLPIDGSAPDVSRAPARPPRTPNDSIFFFKSGQAMTGTLRNGVFTQKATFDTSGWTAAAASRDSLALYSRKTGKLRTGTFRGGIFTVKETVTISRGYTRVAATCDTIMFFNGSSGRSITATLRNGRLGSQRAYTFPAGQPKLVASCDTLQLDYGTAATRAGLLSGGTWKRLGDARRIPTAAVMAATADSYLRIVATTGGQGDWGTFYAGDATGIGSATTFHSWDVVVGTATSVLFYERDGSVAARAMLAGGQYAYAGPGPNLGAGWKIIVGGR